jgi:hypothetical protein
MYKAREPERPEFTGTLPSISQLLTATSHSIVLPSPFSPKYRPSSPSTISSAFEHLSQYRSYYSYTTAKCQHHPPIGATVLVQGLCPMHNNTQKRASCSYQERSGTCAYSTLLPIEQQSAQYCQDQSPYFSAPSDWSFQTSELQARVEYEAGWYAGQRFPRFLGDVLLPGQTFCYVCENSSYLRKKAIDREVVDAKWGLTKAGKPRKRLAQACMACRKKKIRCNPNSPKCAQCNKNGLECRFGSG